MPANSVLAKAPYKIPSVVDTDRVCVVIPCPNDPDHLANLFAAIASLSLWSNYRLRDGVRAKPVADVWADIFYNVDQSECSMITNCNDVLTCLIGSVRIGANGIQIRNPDGSWSDVGTTSGDPRKDGTVPPPWPVPPSGQTGQCLSAANIIELFKNMMADMEAKLTTLATFGTLLMAVEAWFALALGPLGIVVELATEFAAGCIDAGATVVGLAFDPTTQTAAFHGVQCILQCNMNADGSITEAGIENSKVDFFAKIDGWVSDSAQNLAWRLFFPDFLDSQGKNGLTLMGAMANINSSDCSGCDDCPWVADFDFTTDPYISAFYQRDASWIDGVGYVGIDQGGAANNDATLYANFSGTTFESMEIQYDAPDCDSGSNVNLYTGSGPWPSGISAYGSAVLGDCGLSKVHHVNDLRTGVGTFRVDLNFGTVLGHNPLKRLIIRGTGSKPSTFP